MGSVIYIPKRGNLFNAASVFLIDFNRDVWIYNVVSKSLSSLLFNAVGYGDIANTNTRLYITNSTGDGAREYAITLNPFSQVTNRDFTTGSGNAYCYIDNTHIIIGSSWSFYIYDMSTTPPTLTKSISLRSGMISTGDIIYNPYSQTYIVSEQTYATPKHYYLTEYDSDFNFIKAIETTLFSFMGMFVFDNILYAARYINSTESKIYTVIDGVFSEHDTLSIPISGASQAPLANTVRL